VGLALLPARLSGRLPWRQCRKWLRAERRRPLAALELMLQQQVSETTKI
jgi:hypothetical protein